MNRVMDGVRPTMQRPHPIALPRSEPVVVAATSATGPRAFAVGMDGIRRPMLVPTARQALANMQVPELTVSSGAAMMPVWQMPSLRLPQIGWKRPAIAFGLVATALVASTAAVSALSTHTTPIARAAAASERKIGSSSPTPAAPALTAATPAPVPQKTGLQQILDSFAAAYPDKFEIVVKDMNTGESAVISPDRQIASASLYKLFVAQRIYQQIDLGQIDYSKDAGSGTGRNVAECLRIMINISDNACGRALGEILGWGSQDQALSIEGYKQTSLASPQKTSAADVATLLGRLYAGTLVSGNSSDKFMSLLKDQRINNRLPAGLPAGTVIAHKTGDLDGLVHDAGIVYGPKTNYLVVVTSGLWDTPDIAPTLFVDLSSKLWDYFEN